MGDSSEPSAEIETGRPGRDGEYHARRDDGPSGNIDRPQLEAVDGIPDEVADAAAHVQEEGEGEAEHHDPSDPRPDRLLDDGVRSRPGDSGAQPDHQADGADAEDDAGDAIGDRQDRGELRPVDLDVGRQRARPRRPLQERSS